MAIEPVNSPEDFAILLVCTGNVCRSPLAEYQLRRKLFGVEAVTVSSAGTHALVGAPIDEQTRGMAAVLSLKNATNHRASQLTEKMLEKSDLVLTMTREQRREVVGLSPRMTKRTFTLREFARLAEAEETATQDRRRLQSVGTNRAKLRQAVKVIPEYRDVLAPLNDLSDYDVVDPYGKNDGVHILATNQITPAVDSVEQWIRRQLENDF